MLRLQWLTLWDKTREFFENESDQIAWYPKAIVEKMDELEREFIRKAEREHQAVRAGKD